MRERETGVSERPNPKRILILMGGDREAKEEARGDGVTDGRWQIEAWEAETVSDTVRYTSTPRSRKPASEGRGTKPGEWPGGLRGIQGRREKE